MKNAVFIFFFLTNPIEMFKPDIFCTKMKNIKCLNFECREENFVQMMKNPVQTWSDGKNWWNYMLKKRKIVQSTMISFKILNNVKSENRLKSY